MIEEATGTNPKSSKREELQVSDHVPKREKETWFQNMQIFGAIYKCKLDKVQALLESGVKTDITDKNNKDNTPLHWAVDMDKKEIVAELLNPKWNTNINLKNAEGKTPLDLAILRGIPDIVELLQTHEENTNDKSDVEKSLTSLNDLDKKTENKSGNVLTFQRTKGAAGIEGQLCEINLSIFLLLKGTTDEWITKFFLASNLEKADKFDDIVFKYQNKLGTSKIVFLQAKHKADEKVREAGDGSKKQSKGINLNSLLTDSESGDFSLNKYFISYRKIKQHFKDNTDPTDPVFSGNFEDSEFILYTNAAFEYGNRSCIKEFEMDVNSFLRIPGLQSKYFQIQFNSDEKDRIFKLLENSSDCRRLAKALAEAYASGKGLDIQKDIFQSYHQALQNKVIKTTSGSKGKLNDDLLSAEGDIFRKIFFEEAAKALKIPLNNIKKELENKEIKLSHKFSDKNCSGRSDLPIDEPIGEDEVKDFLSKFKLYAFQPNETALEKEIKEIAKDFYKIDQQDIASVFSDVEYQIRNWWQGMDNYLTKDNTYFETAARVSVQFNVKEPVAFFTGRVQELADLHQILKEGGEAVISQKAAITGLGGVGKSELAWKYLSEHKKYYDNNVIWINADNSSTIADSFRRLAQEKLGISTCDEKDQEKKIELVIEDVYNYFAKRHRKSIFVFDNAEKFKMVGDAENVQGIDKFLPQFGSIKPFVLITSRDQEWGNIKHLPIGVFTEQEAADFIKKTLNGILKVEEHDVQRLTKELDHLPLALSQAVAYISVENQESNKWSNEKTFTISNYLDEFKERAIELLNSGFSEHSDRYSQTVMTTWNITKSKIESKTNRAGKFALKMLYVMSYLAPYQISVNEIFEVSSVDEQAIHSAVELLDQYSMVQLQAGKVNIHRLVQQVTRLALEEQNENEQILLITYKLLMGSFPYLSTEIDAVNKKRRTLPHCEAFLLHIDGLFKNRIQERQQIEVEFHQRLLFLMADGYDLNPERRKQLLQRALGIREKHFGPDHYEVAVALVSLGSTYRVLGDAEKSKLMLERALAIEEKHFGPDSNEVAVVLVNLGIAYKVLGDAEKSKLMLERALAIQEKNLEPDDYQVAATLLNLGNTYSNLGEEEKSKLMLERALAIREEQRGPDHYEVASILVNLGSNYRVLGDVEKSKPMLERALAIQEKYFGPEHSVVAATLVNLGITHSSLGNAEKSKQLLERALAIEEKLFGHDHYEVAATLLNLGSTYKVLGDLEKSKQLLERALRIREKHFGPDRYEVAVALVNLGSTYRFSGDSEKSKLLLERALAIREKHFGPDHYEVAVALANLASVYRVLGDVEKSKLMQERALAIDEKHFGPDHRAVAVTLINLGNTHRDLGDADKSKLMLERALTIQENHFGPDHNEVANTLVNLSNTYRSLGDAEKSKLILERALAIKKKLFGADHYEVAVSLGNLGSTYRALGDAKQSKLMLERALAIQENHYGQDHHELAATLGSLAKTYSDLGDAEKSKLMQERALGIQEKHFGPDHYEVAVELMNLATTHSSLGNMEKSKQLFQRALAIREKLLGHDHFEVAAARASLASIYRVLGDAKKSKPMLEHALSIQEKHFGTDHYKVAPTLVNLGNTYSAVGDVEKSKLVLERALAIEEKHYGPDHFELAVTLVNLGNTYKALGDTETSILMHERALAIEEKHFGPDHNKVATTLVNLGINYRVLGDAEKSKLMLERCLPIQERHFGPDHYEVTVTLVNLGTTYRVLGDAEKSKLMLERALAIKENHLGPDHYQVATTLQNLGVTYRVLGEAEKSKLMLERALAIGEKHYGRNHFEVAAALGYLGVTYRVLGDVEKSRLVLERALAIEEKHYGYDHFEVGVTLLSLGTAYRILGDMEKSKVLLQRALTSLKENHALPTFFKYHASDNINALLDGGLDVLERDDHDTILHKAVASNNKEAVNLLLNAIIEKDPGNFAQHINAKDADGDTPLMWAAQTGYLSAANVLLEHRVDINAQNENGETALHWATYGGFLEFVQLLINHNADCNIKNNSERTPFDLAQEKLSKSTDNLESDLLIASLLRSVKPGTNKQ